MNLYLKMLMKYLFLFLFGGVVYAGIEIGFRGYTYFLMGIVGAIAFLLIGSMNEIFEWDTPLLLQMICGSFIVTFLEFVVGSILLQHGIRMWDYSDQWLNYKGVICPFFSVIWSFISLLAIIVDDYLRYWFFGEEKPSYQLL